MRKTRKRLSHSRRKSKLLKRPRQKTKRHLKKRYHKRTNKRLTRHLRYGGFITVEKGAGEARRAYVAAVPFGEEEEEARRAYVAAVTAREAVAARAFAQKVAAQQAGNTGIIK